MLPTLKSTLKVSLTSLILIFSLTEVSLAHDHSSYSHRTGPRANNRRWMTALKNDLRLSDLTIPGTHDTMSLHGTDYVRTQTMDLWSQLVSGVRVLDIRCAIAGEQFKIYHGNIYQNANFTDVLRTVTVFLHQNPGETVMMRVKEENTNDPEMFENIFHLAYWQGPYRSYMWRGKNPNPTLDEVRGKIVILQDFARYQCVFANPPNPQYGICYNSLKIQDEFQLNGNTDLYNKWLKVNQHLHDANYADPNNAFIYMNYLSGSTKGTIGSLGLPFPYFVVSGHWNPATGADRLATTFAAFNNQDRYPDFPRLHSALFGLKYIYYEGTNTLVYDRIRGGREFTRRVGIIMTDFPGRGLINRVICLNFPKDNLCWKS